MREASGPSKHGKPKASFATFIDALVMHALSPAGSLGEHLRMISGTSISDSAAQQRRAALSWSWFEALFALYGGAGFIDALLSQRCEQPCQVLVRVMASRKARVLEGLGDGSALVEVMLEGKSRRKEDRKPLRLREIRAEVRREGQDKKSELRLWTTLLDEREHPAAELARLYAQRWEAELFFGELKAHTRRDNLMRASSIEGAQAEFGALILAASLLAAQRQKLAWAEELPAVRLSIRKIARHMQQAALVLSLSHDLMSAAQQRTFIRRFEKRLSQEARIPPRRQRSCPRGLRKPTTDWPRIGQRCEAHTPCVLSILPISFP